MARLELPLLLDAVRDGSRLAASPDHGELHWRTVSYLGLALAGEERRADRLVLFLFGLLHDARRENEHHDPGHGGRGAELARRLHGAGLVPLGQRQLEMLSDACDRHTDSETSDDPTVGRCWDADRLHLPRVGVRPDPLLFSTQRARLSPPPVPGVPPTWEGLLADV